MNFFIEKYGSKAPRIIHNQESTEFSKNFEICQIKTRSKQGVTMYTYLVLTYLYLVAANVEHFKMHYGSIYHTL